MQLRCQDCGTVLDGTKKDVDESECECGGSLAILNSEDDGYEPNECDQCKKDINSIEDGDSYSCDECGDSNLCEDCIVTGVENVSICKKCIDKAYPRKIETKIEYKEKIVEKPVKIVVDKDGTPMDTTFNPFAKSKFD